MKTFQTLIKLQKTKLDEQRLIVAKLQEQLETVEQKIIELEIRQAREQIIVQENPEMALTYGDFLKKAIKMGKDLEKQRLIATKAVEIARDKLSEMFEEQKRYEIAEDNRIAAELQEEQRLERIEMDEIGSVGFLRRKKG